MSGDAGLHEQPIVFYHRKMTEAKRILLQHKGIELEYIKNHLQTTIHLTHYLLRLQYMILSYFQEITLHYLLL